MKLKKFDTTTVIARRVIGGQKTITFSKKGQLRISGSACAQMVLEPGDKIAIFQDEDNKKDWYISKDQNGFELRDGKAKGTTGLLLSNRALVDIFVKENGFDTDISHKMFIAGKPTLGEEELVGQSKLKKVYWGILVNTNTQFDLK